VSRYAELVCRETKQSIWLGKIVHDEETNQTYFHRGDRELSNSQDPIMMKVIMKFLAQHMGKLLEVFDEEAIDEIIDETWIRIDEDPSLGMGFSEYIDQFPG
jgi:hypothetical protein